MVPVATKRRPLVFRGVMDGTERLFERMVHEHQNRVFAFGLALTGNRHDAEEVAQDTFLRAYRALVTYPPDRIKDLKQKPWLHQIALNVVRNRVRGIRPRMVELNGSEPDHALGPEDDAILKMESQLERCKGVAQRCGFQYKWAFENKSAAEFMSILWKGRAVVVHRPRAGSGPG